MAGQVYFIECADQIKIGFSKNVAERLRKLSAGSVLPVKLVGHIDGCRQFERAIHARLTKHRNNGEWFSDCVEVREVVAALIASGAAAIGFVATAPEQPAPAPILPRPIPQHYRFKNARKFLALICVRIAHAWADLAEFIAPWLNQ